MIYRIASITTDMHHYGFCVGRKAGGVGYKATTNLGHVDGGNGGRAKKQGKLATQNSKIWGNSILSSPKSSRIRLINQALKNYKNRAS